MGREKNGVVLFKGNKHRILSANWTRDRTDKQIGYGGEHVK